MRLLGGVITGEELSLQFDFDKYGVDDLELGDARGMLVDEIRLSGVGISEGFANMFFLLLNFKIKPIRSLMSVSICSLLVRACSFGCKVLQT